MDTYSEFSAFTKQLMKKKINQTINKFINKTIKIRKKEWKGENISPVEEKESL